jgi:hypothetical protein
MRQSNHHNLFVPYQVSIRWLVQFLSDTISLSYFSAINQMSSSYFSNLMVHSIPLTFGIIQSPKIILRYTADEDYTLYY